MSFSILQRTYRKFNTFIKWFLAILMMVIAALTFYQVVMRYVFNNSPSWSEELVRFMFIWSTFLAAAIGIKEHIHIGIDVFVKILPQSVQKIIQTIVYLAIIFFSGYMIKYGWAVTQMTKRQASPAIGIPMSWIYISVPVMGVLLIMYCIMETFFIWKSPVREGN